MSGDRVIGDRAGGPAANRQSPINHQSPITNHQRRTNHRSLITILLVLITNAFGALAHAAEPRVENRFQNVALLTARDRVSLVFELTGEPRDVATRRVSAAVLELDAGPVDVPARPTSFMAPPGTRFVMGVSIQPGDGVAGRRLKARITLLERARSGVRVVGRRVYVDFSSDALEVSRVEGLALSRVEGPGPAMTDRATPARAAAPTAAASAPPATAPVANAAYRAAVGTAIERFEQLTPFMLSATTAPSEPVLKAVGSTLAGIQGLLTSVDVPAESRQAYDALSSAVAAAVTAVSPAFSADRAAQARQAVRLFEDARTSW